MAHLSEGMEEEGIGCRAAFAKAQIGCSSRDITFGQLPRRGERYFSLSLADQMELWEIESSLLIVRGNGALTVGRNRLSSYRSVGGGVEKAILLAIVQLTLLLLSTTFTPLDYRETSTCSQTPLPEFLEFR